MRCDLARGLIVSCQAEGDSPFNTPAFIAAFARAAEMGGAVAVRIAGADNVRAVRGAVRLPIVALTKGGFPDGSVLITPTLDDARALAEAGADIVAVDATSRKRPGGPDGAEFVMRARAALGVPVLADVSTADEGAAAARAGAAWVATTLSGYTPETSARATEQPDLDFVAHLAARLPRQVIAEGRIWTPDQAAAALDAGAWAVVVGTAITRPIDIVRRFAHRIDAAVHRQG